MRYIGSKKRVLPFIEHVVSNTYGEVDNAVVADLFAGTACVGEMFKRKGARIITNDYMRFSFALQIAKVRVNKPPKCKISYHQAIESLNRLNGINGFFYHEYTTEGTKKKLFCRNYFSTENAKKIDTICLTMKNWLANGSISLEMYYLLCHSLLDAITKVSNTSGTYGSFLKIDDPRKYKDIVLESFATESNGKENKCYCKDIFDIIDHVSGDILYLDPPYNSRQYPPYYHILETAVLYDTPSIYGITGRRHYEDKNSPLCRKNDAKESLKDIVLRARFQHIYISYSTDGIINVDEFINDLSKETSIKGVQCFYKGYRRYKSNDGGLQTKKLKELIIYVEK